MPEMTAYHGDETLKTHVLDQLRAHREAGRIKQASFWEWGKGCENFPALWGIPIELAYLMGSLFEYRWNVPEGWPLRVMEAIPVGADLSHVWGRWALWMLRNLPRESPGTLAVAGLYERRLAGTEPSREEWGATGSACDGVAALGVGPMECAARAAARVAQVNDEPKAVRTAVGWAVVASEWGDLRQPDWSDAACDELMRLLREAPNA